MSPRYYVLDYKYLKIRNPIIHPYNAPSIGERQLKNYGKNGLLKNDIMNLYLDRDIYNRSFLVYYPFNILM